VRAGVSAAYSSGDLLRVAREKAQIRAHIPDCASRRPAATAAARAAWSRSFWSAYVSAKSAIALSNLVDLPRYAEIAIRSPARACARASVQPHSPAYRSMLRGPISSITADIFQSRSCRM
jgi:hypothetical protein